MALAFPFPKIGTRTEVCFPMEMLYDLGTLQEKTPELLFTFERIIKSNKWQKILLSLLALRALWIYLWRSCLCPAEKGEGRTSLRECCFSHFGVLFCWSPGGRMQFCWPLPISWSADGSNSRMSNVKGQSWAYYYVLEIPWLIPPLQRILQEMLESHSVAFWMWIFLLLEF